MDVALSHPAFAALRPWLEQLREPLRAGLEQLNAFAARGGLRVASGAPLRFVAPSADKARYGEYELQVFETGCVATRPGNLHDLFNALAWLAFPRTKAALNARHAAAIPAEHGRRGRLRDLLTLRDEGGAIVVCGDAMLASLLAARDWTALFWDQRRRTASAFDVRILGHAALEQALAPWPGLTCKALLVPPGDADAQAAAWIDSLPADGSPQLLPPLPIFGLPGWWPEQEAAFYADTRYFRPGAGAARDKIPPGSRPGSRYGDIEESPGSAERDAG